MSITVDLLATSTSVDEGFSDDRPILLIAAEIPHANSVPDSLKENTHDDDWWSDGISYEQHGTYNGVPLHVVEPNHWKLHDGGGLALYYTFEGVEGLIAEEHPIIIEEAAIEKCVIFNPHDGLDKSLFPKDTFIIYDF